MSKPHTQDAGPGPLLLDVPPPSPAVAAAAEPPPSPPLVMDIEAAGDCVVVPDAAPSRSDDVTAVVESEDAAAEAPRVGVGAKWPLRLFIGGTVAAVAVGVGFDAADLLGRAFAVSRGLGWGVAAALSGAAAGLLGMLWREWRGLARLRRFDALRARADRLSASRDGAGGAGGAERVVGAVAALYAGRPELAAGLERLRLHLPDAHDDRQMLQLLEQEVLAPLDAAAYRLASQAARDTALATAVMPVALLDMLIVLWRNLKLVRAVATLYGVRPGYWASLALMRRLLGNLAVAGVGEGVQHAVADALGGSLAAAVSTSLGKGVINGLLTARIGLAAMHFCRPLPFSPQRRPSLSGIRGVLLGLPRNIL